jgi:transposase
MANANPAQSGDVSSNAVPLKENQEVLKKENGGVVIRTTEKSGNVTETHVFAGDYPEAKTEVEQLKEQLAAEKAKSAPRTPVKKAGGSK